MFDLFKSFATPTTITEHVEPEPAIIKDDTQERRLAAELQLTIVRIGDRVRVDETSVFDAGAIGIVESIEVDHTTIRSKGKLIVVESNAAERLISQSDIASSLVDAALESVRAQLHESTMVLGAQADDIEIIQPVLDRAMINHSFAEISTPEFIVSVTEEVAAHFPKISQGIVVEQIKYNTLTGA